ncbi:serine hydrolase [Fontibacillus sp. BL9]|uniref:serine hydrolase n=1 Tax=Fontibacillus sp. BL9 TaxID=3389971 RepID=UPI00397CF0C8
MKKRFMLVLAVLLAFSASGLTGQQRAAAQASPLSAESVGAFAEGFFQQEEVRDQLAGAIVVVVQDGRVLLNQGYGYADAEARKPVDAEKTLFRVASVSKLFTAVGIMQLAEAGKVDLNANVQTYLPDLTIPNETGSPLTLKHLLTHTSGFDSGDYAVTRSPYALSDFVKDNMPTVVKKPGEAYRYDNFAFALQGYVIEKVSGLSFEDYMSKEIFEPLGMLRSSFILNDDVKKNLATPYNSALEPIGQSPNVPDNSPGGGLFSTGADMAKFLDAMLNSGQRGESRILNEESVKEMERNQVSIQPEVPGVGYGLESNYPQYYNGYRVVEKGGDLSGFHSNLWLMPDEDTGVFLALNSDKGNLRNPFFEQFMNRYFPKKGSGPAFVELLPSDRQLQAFEGLYRHLRTPALLYDITAEDGRLIVKDVFGKHALRQAGELLFYDEEGMPAGFKLDAEGRIAYFSYNLTDGWAEKLPDPPLFSDVPEDHPFAAPIYKMVQMGVMEGSSEVFEPGKPMTRGEFLAALIPLTGFPFSTRASVFKDTAGSPYETAIQTAAEFGVALGRPDGFFGPDEPIRREEAATYIWRLAKFALDAPPEQADLKGPVAPWASEGVQYVVSRGLYGPEVEASDGKLDYKPQAPLLRQEAAALIDMLQQNLL